MKGALARFVLVDRNVRLLPVPEDVSEHERSASVGVIGVAPAIESVEAGNTTKDIDSGTRPA
jgi:hypothetical protein